MKQTWHYIRAIELSKKVCLKKFIGKNITSNFHNFTITVLFSKSYNPRKQMLQLLKKNQHQLFIYNRNLQNKIKHHW